jgi:hypothetical protein
VCRGNLDKLKIKRVIIFAFISIQGVKAIPRCYRKLIAYMATQLGRQQYTFAHCIARAGMV